MNTERKLPYTSRRHSINQWPPGHVPPYEEFVENMNKMSAEALAKFYHVGSARIRKWKHSYGIPVKHRKGMKRPPREEIIAMVEAGLGSLEISLKYGVQQETVITSWFYEYNIPIPKGDGHRPEEPKITKDEMKLVSMPWGDAAEGIQGFFRRSTERWGL